MREYDVIVIGMGPAGMAASSFANSAGLKVLTIEKNKVGGECLNCGCIPSKAILKVAQLKNSIENMEQFGLQLNGDVEIKDALGLIREKIDNIGKTKATKMFENVDTLVNQGEAEFIEPHIIKVGNELYCGNAIFIATGSEPFIPPIKGIENVPYLTNRNLFRIDNLPKTLTIIGGGAIACEMAQAFSRLGTKINMINMDSHIIPVMDKDVTDVLEDEFGKNNITILNNTTAKSVEKVGEDIYVHTDKGTFISDTLFIAAGRKPAINSLNLDKIGIKYTKNGISVDEFNRTNIGHIYAVGDCNGKYLFSHAAMHQGMLSAMHLLKLGPACSLKRSAYAVPWAIFTEPNIAKVGMTQEEAVKNNIEHLIVKDYYKDYGRALIDSEVVGFIKVIATPQGRLLGASIVGNSASELITEWTTAIQNNLTLQDVAMMQHPFPTLSLLNARVSQKFMMQTMEKKRINKKPRKNFSETA